jgi:hypothetical protein
VYDEDLQVFTFDLSRADYVRLAEIAAYVSASCRLPGADPPRLTVAFLVQLYVAQGITEARVPLGPSSAQDR